MAKGEILQLTRTNEIPDQKEYLEIIFNKTACLFAAALQIGAILGKATEEEQRKLYDYGNCIGTY
jgi:octaprenyl-diphosphate synthase